MTTDKVQLPRFFKINKILFFSIALFHFWQPLTAQTSFETMQNAISKQLDSSASGSFYFRDGARKFQKSVGEADRRTGMKNGPNTAFQTGSVSKVFTAVAILQLSQAKKLSLQDRVSDYLPAFNNDKVNILHLLSHTSGIPEKEELFLKAILAGDTLKKYENADMPTKL